MEVLIYLVPIALGLGLLGLGAFLWALNTGQYDDLEGAAWRALMDDDEVDAADTHSRHRRACPGDPDSQGTAVPY
jgi:cbb3-type cytochrome oxidase maturation protein